MTKKIKTLLLTTLLLLALVIFLFSKCTTSKKYYSPDQRYSVYSKTYWYSELACAAFSTMDCSYAGTIYLYDERSQEVLESVYTPRVSAVESVSWSIHDQSVLFKDSAVEIDNYAWKLPKELK